MRRSSEPVTLHGPRLHARSSSTKAEADATTETREQLMIKVSFCMRRLPHLSREEFQAYWRDKHPMAVPPEAIPVLGVKRYIQVHTLDTDATELVVGPRTGLEEPLDGIAELWVESLDALKRDWSTDKAKEIVQIFFDDEKNFIDWSRSTILVSEEIVVMP